MARNKWQHDGIDAHEAWWYGPTDDIDQALATVHPYWGPTRCDGRGKPGSWRVLVGGNCVGYWPTRREATRAAELHIHAKQTA